MNEEFNCPICGEPTFKFYGNYRKDKLCSKHATELKNGNIEIIDKNEYLDEEEILLNDNINIYIDSKTYKILNETIPKNISNKLKNYFEFPKDNHKNCIICNNPSYGYAFCKECYYNENIITLQRAGERNKNQLNNKTAEDIEVKKTVLPQENKNNVVIINETNKSKCITCGRQTEGLLFCSACYHKYKNKELLFKITNCTNVELLDESYEGRYTCPDGHIVKSKSERDIDRYLFEKNIPHAYEIELSYGPSENEIIHPDFFLPHYLGKDKHVYIEHWGYNDNNISYTKTKKFKLPIYKQLGITLICTDEKKDASKIDAVLDRKLNKKFIKENEINFDD